MVESLLRIGDHLPILLFCDDFYVLKVENAAPAHESTHCCIRMCFSINVAARWVVYWHRIGDPLPILLCCDDFDVLKVENAARAHEFTHWCIRMCFAIYVAARWVVPWHRIGEPLPILLFCDDFDVLKVENVAPAHEFVHWCITMKFAICVAVLGSNPDLRIGDALVTHNGSTGTLNLKQTRYK